MFRRWLVRGTPTEARGSESHVQLLRRLRRSTGATMERRALRVLTGAESVVFRQRTDPAIDQEAAQEGIEILFAMHQNRDPSPEIEPGDFDSPELSGPELGGDGGK